MKRPIEPSQIRKGDALQWEGRMEGLQQTRTFTALYDKHMAGWGSLGQFYLLDRPAPAVELPTEPTLGMLTFYAGDESSGLGIHRSRLGIFQPEAGGLTDDAGAGMWPATSIVSFEPMAAVPTSALDVLRAAINRHHGGMLYDFSNDCVEVVDTFLAAVDAANGGAA